VVFLRGSCHAKNVELTRDLVNSLALEAGFTSAGVTAIPPEDSPHSRDERLRFAQWIEAGAAGEMEYLKRVNENGDYLRSSVRSAFPWAQSAIVCVTNYNSSCVRSTDPAEPSAAWIARYAWSGSKSHLKLGSGADSEHKFENGFSLRPADYHKVLLQRLQRLDANLKGRLGAFDSRCYVDTGPLVERVYARYAGVGWTGKNTCILNQQLGSWLFLGVIITSLPLSPAQQPLQAADRCGSCTRCIDACPTQALTPYRMDAARCISYLTIEKRGPIAEDLREGMGRQVFGCDICQDVCPWNRKAPIAVDSELAPRDALINPALDWLAAMDEQEFGRWFFGSPVKRAKFQGFRRNLAIAMGNSGLARFLPALREWAQSGNAVIAETAAWAAGRIAQLTSDPKVSDPHLPDARVQTRMASSREAAREN
jgi:epoxyqueuosine reductase